MVGSLYVQGVRERGEESTQFALPGVPHLVLGAQRLTAASAVLHVGPRLDHACRRHH